MADWHKCLGCGSIIYLDRESVFAVKKHIGKCANPNNSNNKLFLRCKLLYDIRTYGGRKDIEELQGIGKYIGSIEYKKNFIEKYGEHKWCNCECVKKTPYDCVCGCACYHCVPCIVCNENIDNCDCTCDCEIECEFRPCPTVFSLYTKFQEKSLENEKAQKSL